MIFSDSYGEGVLFSCKRRNFPKNNEKDLILAIAPVKFLKNCNLKSPPKLRVVIFHLDRCPICCSPEKGVDFFEISLKKGDKNHP
jgi:hypothetical protein